MASRLTPYINLRGNARQALEFYRDVFGGTLDMNTYSEFGMTDPPFAEQVMHGQLDTPSGFTLMCADLPPYMDRTSGDTVTICLNGDDAAELRGFWKQLSEGGSVTVPLEVQMWGDEFGECVDRFGITWLVNISLPEVGSPR